MICPHCHAALTADARFCPACGKATVPTATASGPLAGAPDLVGREIAGRYRIDKKLGEGGMGAVYRGEQISLKRAVAVKLLRPELGTNQMILRRFNAEAEAVAKLNHPNIVNIYDFGQDRDGSLFIAMEYIDGRSLRDAIQQQAPFTPRRALEIAAQIAASLVDAHAHSIIHRDLKPDNVMLQDRGKQRDIVRVLDFGIAKLRDDTRGTQAAMTQAGDMLGTPQYMSPEQIRGEAIDGRVDIYSLGCMIYEMVTARMAYEAPTVMAMLSKHLLEQVVPPSQRRPDLGIPPAIDELVLRALAKDPAARPPTMEAFSELIAAVLQTLPADPNRSAGMPQGAALPPAPTPAGPGFASGPAVTPAPPGAFPPPITAPPPIAPRPPIAPPFAPPSLAPPAKSRAPIIAVIGVLALGGGGAGMWALSHDKPKSQRVEKKIHEDKPDDPDDKEGEDAPAAPGSADPWSQNEHAGNAPAAAPAASIPPGVHIEVPPGFTGATQNGALVYVNATTGEMILMAPLFNGTNDPDQLAALWTKETGFKKISKAKVLSAGKMRDGISFIKDMPNGKAAQVAVLYIEPTYRVGIVYQAPAQMFLNKQWVSQVDAFFRDKVFMP